MLKLTVQFHSDMMESAENIVHDLGLEAWHGLGPHMQYIRVTRDMTLSIKTHLARRCRLSIGFPMMTNLYRSPGWVTNRSHEVGETLAVSTSARRTLRTSQSICYLRWSAVCFSPLVMIQKHVLAPHETAQQPKDGNSRAGPSVSTAGHVAIITFIRHGAHGAEVQRWWPRLAAHTISGSKVAIAC